MDNHSNRSNLVLGAVLVALGVVFLVGMLFQQSLGRLDWDSLWPLTILGAGGLFFIGMLVGGRAASGLAIPASIITTVGGILLFMNTFGYWETWSYAWTLIIFAVGAGLVIHGKLGGQEEAVRSGFRTMGVALVLFLVFGAMMEFIFSVTGVSARAGNLLFPLGLALLGGYQFFRRVYRLMNPGESRRDTNLFWPVILIGLGVLWALANLEMLSGEQALVLLRLWPVLLVAVGLDLIFGRRSPWVGALLGVLVVAGMFAFVGYGTALNLPQRAPWLYEGVSFGGLGRGETVTGSGQSRVEERPVRSFTRVDLRGQGTIELAQGAQESLEIEAEANLLPYIVTRVAGGELVIETKDNANLRPTRPIRYRITVRDLQAFSISGSGEADLGALQTGSLEVRINGSGSIRLADLQAGRLTVKINGSGELQAAGKVETLDVNINGSGQLQAAELSAGQVEVDIPGSGEVVVWATDSLEITINGSGTVGYYGDPQVQHGGETGRINRLGSK